MHPDRLALISGTIADPLGSQDINDDDDAEADKSFSDAVWQIRAMGVLEEAFKRLVRCSANDKIVESEREHYSSNRQGLFKIFTAFRGDASVQVRIACYCTLVELSELDSQLVRDSCDALVQRLDSADEAEFDATRLVLCQYLGRSTEVALGVLIDTHCRGPLRGTVLKFLNLPETLEQIKHVIAERPSVEHLLGEKFAMILPLNLDPVLFRLIQQLLRLVKSPWLAHKFESEDAKDLTCQSSQTGSVILSGFCEALLVKHRLVRGPAQATPDCLGIDATVLHVLDQHVIRAANACIPDGAAHVARLSNVILGLDDRGEKRPAPTNGLSPVQLYLLDLDEATRAFQSIISPLWESTTEEVPTCHYFSPVQMVAFSRSATNLAARIAMAATKAPEAAGYGKDQATQDLARIGAEMLKKYCDAPDKKNHDKEVDCVARDTFRILVGEALLTAIRLVESYQIVSDPHRETYVWKDPHLRSCVDKLKTLATRKVADETLSSELKSSAQIIVEHATELRRRYPSTELKLPGWVEDPPPFPQAVDQEPLPPPAPPEGRGSRGQKRSFDTLYGSGMGARQNAENSSRRQPSALNTPKLTSAVRQSSEDAKIGRDTSDREKACSNSKSKSVSPTWSRNEAKNTDYDRDSDRDGNSKGRRTDLSVCSGRSSLGTEDAQIDDTSTTSAVASTIVLGLQ
ncbi:hypothetical protein BCV70DRAFT_206530 [Testicularia cyperi]|uniref:Uncharacterized protein n=1 Tax=Testicularia cyperi TaxID=1882483 RepID=A0A317XSF4_9BASI|nr:hypothetical protein BCV70DRAFT_206530 [Testicularia cyperi]